jgi:hypothetical protein
MSYQNPRVAETAKLLKERLKEAGNKSEILRAVELKALFDEIKTLSPEERGPFGQEETAPFTGRTGQQAPLDGRA